ncbi:MAG: hypothetical protein Harvfovirus75_7 [Harvfovirus sp.]|uniref:Uncharacterized protein n=1 Tax=Harvfovirus sp. TaxID=2487768 RepID=A0A3G5A6N6_9VIRU|nr:MAG: hypothetical protein Harvfovirus75_7 [Harvfovirus sp.]
MGFIVERPFALGNRENRQSASRELVLPADWGAKNVIMGKLFI